MFKVSGTTQWYAVLLPGVIVLTCVANTITAVARAMLRRVARKYRLHIRPRWEIRRPLFLRLTAFELLILIMFAGVNSFCILFQANGRSVVASRCGILAAVNLTPLLVGSHISDLADYLGLSLRSAYLIHRWVSYVSVTESICHVVMLFIQGKAVWTSSYIVVIAGALAMLSAVVLPSLCIRRWFYEFFLSSHMVLSVFAIGSIFWHLAKQSLEVRVYVLTGIALWASSVMIRLLIDLRTNLVRRYRRMSPMTIETSFITKSGHRQELPGACIVTFEIPQSMAPRPGQYFYIRVPMLGRFSIFQSHPFYAASWEVDRQTGALKVEVLVEIRHGLTRRFPEYKDRPRHSWISGPYGLCCDLDHFGSVLMFASGIGIAAHLSCLKWLVESRERSLIPTRRVLVVWEVKNLNHVKWIRKWFDALLANDETFTLAIKIFGPETTDYTHLDAEGREIRTRVEKGDSSIAGHHGLLEMTAARPNISEIVSGVTSRTNRGRLLITNCTNSDLTREIKTCVRSAWDEDITYREPEFQPKTNPRFPVD